MVCFFLGDIARAWQTYGVGGTGSEVETIVQLMSGEGNVSKSFNCIFSTSFCLFIFSTSILGIWPHRNIKNADVIRMFVTCEMMEVDTRDSIYYMAIKALGINPKDLNK